MAIIGARRRGVCDTYPCAAIVAQSTMVHCGEPTLIGVSATKRRRFIGKEAVTQRSRE
jgi:hypothetical protein